MMYVRVRVHGAYGVGVVYVRACVCRLWSNR